MARFEAPHLRWIRPTAGVRRLALLLAQLGAEAQSPAKVFRIGILGAYPMTFPKSAHVWEAFRQELRDLGYVEGKNILIDDH